MARGRRDRYGRYRGKGGLKAWKNNNPSFGKRPRYVRRGSGKHNATSGYRPKGIAPQKKSSAKKKIILGAVAVGATAAGAYGIHKYRQKRSADALATTGASAKPVGKTGRKVVSKVARLRPGTPIETPKKAPIKITPPKQVNAKSILTTAAAASTAMRVSTAVSEDERAANESKDKWVRIERARQAGIPRAADFIANGGTDAEIRAAEKKNGQKQALTLKPSVVKEAPVHTESQQKAQVQKAARSFAPVASGIAIASPRQLGMANERGNPIRIFPQTRLNTRPSSIATRKQKEAELNKQYGRSSISKPKAQTVKNMTAPDKPIKSPTSVTGTPVKKVAPKSSPAKKAAAPKREAPPKVIQATPKAAKAAPYSKERAKTFEQMTLEEQATFLRGDARKRNKARPLGGARTQQRFADFQVKHVSQATIRDGGKYQETFAAPEKKRKPRRS